MSFFIGVPYYVGDQKGDPNLENYPFIKPKPSTLSRKQAAASAKLGSMLAVPSERMPITDHSVPQRTD